MRDERQDADIRQVQEARQRSSALAGQGQRLQPGDWIRLNRRAGSLIFCASPGLRPRNRYVFVNHQGMS